MAAKVKTSKDFKVVQQSGDRAGRTLFRGLEADARDFIQRNHPRPHVDEFTTDPNRPVHDVKLVTPIGTEEVYHSKDGWQPRPNYADDDTEVDEGDE